MKLIDIARSFLSAPEGDGTGTGGGAPPAAGANGGGGEAKKDGEGAAGDGAEKKDGQKGDEKAAGAGDPAKANKGDAAGEYKIAIPDGVKVDEQRMKSFTDWAKDKAKLTPEQASSAMAYYLEQQQTLDAAWAKQGEDWGAALKADKDFGGAKYDANVAAAQKAVLRFGGRELADAITELGLTNHPLLTKAFAKVGHAFKEDTAATETAPKGGEPKPGDRKARDAKRYDHPDSQQARAGK